MFKYRRPTAQEDVQFQGLILGRQIPKGCLDQDGKYGITTFVRRNVQAKCRFRLPADFTLKDDGKERYELVYPILEPRNMQYDLLQVLKPPNVINSIGIYDFFYGN